MKKTNSRTAINSYCLFSSVVTLFLLCTGSIGYSQSFRQEKPYKPVETDFHKEIKQFSLKKGTPIVIQTDGLSGDLSNLQENLAYHKYSDIIAAVESGRSVDISTEIFENTVTVENEDYKNIGTRSVYIKENQSVILDSIIIEKAYAVIVNDKYTISNEKRKTKFFYDNNYLILFSSASDKKHIATIVYVSSKYNGLLSELKYIELSEMSKQNGGILFHTIDDNAKKNDANIFSLCNKTINLLPNPASKECTIISNIGAKGMVSIAVYDNTGKKVLDVITDKLLLAGEHYFHISDLNLLPGIYNIKLSTSNNIEAAKFIVQ